MDIKLERMTARSPKNGMAYLVGVREDEQDLEGAYNTLMCVKNSFERLAAYEDSGLTPGEVMGIAEERARVKSRGSE